MERNKYNGIITIIPDVHGRPFWRDAVRDAADIPVVFLGDYLDPYPQDGVHWAEAWRGLRDILALKRKYPDRVTLLLGNHDVHYFDDFPFFSQGGRMYHDHARKIRALFMDNLYLFDLALCLEGESGKWLFSHAGVNDRWAEANVRYIERNMPELYGFAMSYERAFRTPEGAADFLNRALHSKDRDIFRFLIWSLGDVSASRGGRGVGSCVWADFHDFYMWLPAHSTALRGCRQIVGHTRQEYWDDVLRAIRDSGPVLCTDFGRAFSMDLRTGVLRSKMERKRSFHPSDLSSLPVYDPFDLDIWNLTPRARKQAEEAIGKALEAGLLIRVPEQEAYCSSPLFADGDRDTPNEYQMEAWERYLSNGKRYL